MSSGSSTLSLTASLTPNPTTPVIVDDLEWITAYLTIHRLSETSWRYAYLLWIVIAFVSVVFAFFHSMGLRGGVVGAYWSKWSLRRRTWRKKHSLAMAKRRGQPHKQPIPLPSNAQILSLTLLSIAAFAVMAVGPDYLAPSNKLWEFRRDSVLVLRAVNYDASMFFKFQPQYTISKAWWTAGGRAGLIAFALFPLCILFALKAPPFAIFAIPFFINLHFDKLMWLHRWLGRLIWFISAVHVALWSVQLVEDRRVGTDQIAYVYAWQYPKFLYAWTAFGLFTLLIILSLQPIRDRHYEAFYFLHILLVPLTIIMSALHHPPVWWWCWAALALWIGERTWRGTKWLYTNGFVGSHVSSSRHLENHTSSAKELEMRRLEPNDGAVRNGDKQSGYPRSPLSTLVDDEHRASVPSGLPRFTHHSDALSASSDHFLIPPLKPALSYVPPSGYAHAELLAGRTIRLRLITPGYLTWAPGQNFLLCVPSVSKFLSHPFTSASVCDEQIAGDDGRMLVFLIRAKNGWTKDLWDAIVALTSGGRKYPQSESPPIDDLPAMGVLMRCWVDGPFGSTSRTDWGMYSSVLIVAGGSGVSFGLSVLKYLSLCMSGREGRFLGGSGRRSGSRFKTRRVRFVWVVREFSHIQWCATTLRQCRALVPTQFLQIEIFVTNFKPSARNFPSSPRFPPTPISASTEATLLSPPTPRFVQKVKHAKRGEGRVGSDDPHQSDTEPADAYVDLSYYTGEFNENSEPNIGELGHEEHVLDLTNFDGDNDDQMPGESSMNHTVKKEGRIRRALSRRLSNSQGLLQGDLNIQSAATLPSSLPHDPSNRLSVVPEGHSRNSSRDSQRMLSEVDLGNVADGEHKAPLNVAIPSPRHSQASFRSYGRQDAVFSAIPRTPDWDTRSAVSDVNSLHALMPQVGTGAFGEQVQLQWDEGEMQDINVMAEFAIPGRPKLDVILRDEVGSAAGAVAVACCGPTTLNAVIRKIVASQIDPARIRRGDMSGSIALVAEEFSY